MFFFICSTTAVKNNNNDGTNQMIEDLGTVGHATDPTAYVRSLPAPVRRRLKALKKLQSDMSNIEAKFFEELHQLECKYETLYNPFYVKRYKIVSAEVEPDDNECQWPSEDEGDSLEDDFKKKASIDKSPDSECEEMEEEVDMKGVPEFWLRIFKNVEILADLIEENDEPILKHLLDIRVRLLNYGAPGFVLEFVFEPNEYFTNTLLTKEYTMNLGPDPEDVLSYEGPEIVRCKGCSIDWKDGRNVTVKRVQKTQRRKGQDARRTVVKTVRTHSFFNFFSPPQVQEGEVLDDETEDILSADYEIGHFLRDRVVPKAVLYYTGEALDSDESEEYDEEGEEVIIDHTQESGCGGGDTEEGSEQEPSQ